MNRLFFTFLIFLLFSGCISNNPVVIVPEKLKTIDAVGYSALSNFENYSMTQRKLLAIRSAKLDAYRNLAEEVYGVRIKSNTTVKNMLIESDSYRAYVDAIVRGAHLVTITPKENGVYEAEVTLILTPKMASCLYRHSMDCSNLSTSYAEDHNQNYSYPFLGSSYDSGVISVY